MRAFFLDNKESAIGSRNKQSSPPTLSGLVSSTLGNGHVYPGPSIPSTPNNDSSAEISAVQTEYLYFRTKTGDVVAIPATSSDVQIQEISGLIGPARTSPNQFGIPIDAVLSLETWKEKVGIEQSITRQNTALYFTEDLLNFLRRSHDQLAFEMECMLEEIIVRFRPEPEEELLTAVHALLLKCYQLPLLNKSELAPRMLQGTLAKVCKKFFVLMPFQKHEKHLRFVNEFKEKFELDFAVRSNLNIEIDQESSTPTLYDIIRRLQYWKKLLQTRVQNAGERNGNKLYLEHSSRHLIELSSTAMEVPGQYISDAEPIKDLHARIAYFENTSDVILRNGYTQRRITVGGSNGKRYSFLVQYAMTHITRTDERVMQMHLLLNRLLLRHKESRRRNAVYHVQKVVPLTPRVRLLEDSTDFVTLGEVS
jgi:phosphatidylinositol kinase/protein kinase (PI-3  family)